MTNAKVPAIALLPVRLFFGVTFLYAGLDKLLDPSFFDASAATSLHAQLEAFARFSPLGDLIRATLPLATPIGLLIALGEIGVGIGALTGLAFRVAAAGGAAISLLLFLTASWATHPYYLGNDLPYAFGWIALAIAGHGDLLVPRRILELGAAGGPWSSGPASESREAGRSAGRSRRRRLAARDAARLGRGEAAVGFSVSPRVGSRQPDEAPSPERRMLLQTGVLAGIAAIVASLTLPLRAVGVASGHVGTATGSPAPTSAPGGGSSPTPPPAAGGTVPPGRTAIATVASVTRTGSAAFTVPIDAPAPLPGGDPGVIVQLTDGSFVAYDAICTHQGCTVEYDKPDQVLICPCHEAVYDPANDAAVLQGPTGTPLTKLPIVIDQASGKIYLAG